MDKIRYGFEKEEDRQKAFYEIFVVNPIGVELLEYLKNKYYYVPSYEEGGRSEDAIFKEGKKALIRDILMFIKEAKK